MIIQSGAGTDVKAAGGQKNTDILELNRDLFKATFVSHVKYFYKLVAAIGGDCEVPSYIWHVPLLRPMSMT